MKQNIFFVMLGAFVAVILGIGFFNLSYWLFYPNHHPEDVSVISEIVLLAISVIVGMLTKSRFFGVGMFVGCLLGFFLLTLSLWGT